MSDFYLLCFFNNVAGNTKLGWLFDLVKKPCYFQKVVSCPPCPPARTRMAVDVYAVSFYILMLNLTFEAKTWYASPCWLVLHYLYSKLSEAHKHSTLKSKQDSVCLICHVIVSAWSKHWSVQQQIVTIGVVLTTYQDIQGRPKYKTLTSHSINVNSLMSIIGYNNIVFSTVMLHNISQGINTATTISLQNQSKTVTLLAQLEAMSPQPNHKQHLRGVGSENAGTEAVS